jgi:hypothetical protein
MVRIVETAASGLVAEVGKVAASVWTVRVVEAAASVSEAWVEEALLSVEVMAKVANLKLDLIEEATASLDEHCSRSTSALGC